MRKPYSWTIGTDPVGESVVWKHHQLITIWWSLLHCIDKLPTFLARFTQKIHGHKIPSGSI